MLPSTSDLARQCGPLVPADFYLLENWDSGSAEDAVAQRTRLFRKFMQLGSNGRRQYFQAWRKVESLQPHYPSREQYTSILIPARTRRERETAFAILEPTARVSSTWARVHYGATYALGDSAAQALEAAGHVVLNDPERYNFGRDWRRLLHVFPELVDSYRNPEAYGDRKPSVRLSALDVARKERYAAFIDDRPLESEEIAFLDHYARSIRHHSAVTGFMLLEDADSERSGTLVAIWLDQVGRIVRQTRKDPFAAESVVTLVGLRKDAETFFTNAQDGEERLILQSHEIAEKL